MKHISNPRDSGTESRGVHWPVSQAESMITQFSLKILSQNVRRQVIEEDSWYVQAYGLHMPAHSYTIHTTMYKHTHTPLGGALEKPVVWHHLLYFQSCGKRRCSRACLSSRRRWNLLTFSGSCRHKSAKFMENIEEYEVKSPIQGQNPGSVDLRRRDKEVQVVGQGTVRKWGSLLPQQSKCNSYPKDKNGCQCQV